MEQCGELSKNNYSDKNDTPTSLSPHHEALLSSFGQFGGDLLVGNFVASEINAFDPTTGMFEGYNPD